MKKLTTLTTVLMIGTATTADVADEVKIDLLEDVITHEWTTTICSLAPPTYLIEYALATMGKTTGDETLEETLNLAMANGEAVEKQMQMLV